jgi:hypothetical protein
MHAKWIIRKGESGSLLRIQGLKGKNKMLRRVRERTAKRAIKPAIRPKKTAVIPAITAAITPPRAVIMPPKSPMCQVAHWGKVGRG